jgi:hypothetical protein
MPHTFTCPACHTVLKTKAEVPAGKKIKCPKCAMVFLSQESLAEEPRSAVERIRGSAREVTRQQDIYAGKPSAPVTARRQTAEIEYKSSTGRPVRQRSKRPRKAHGRRLLLALISGGTAFAILILLLGFVWPGFFSGKGQLKTQQPPVQAVAAEANDVLPKGTGNEDLLSFVPKDCNAFVGFDAKSSDRYPRLASYLRVRFGTTLTHVNKLPNEARYAFTLMDRALLAYNTTFKNQHGFILTFEGVAVIRKTQPYDRAELLRKLGAKKSERINDKTVYPIAGWSGPDRLVAYMPNDRILVLATAIDTRLDKLLAFSGTDPVISPQAISAVRKVEKSCAWMAATDAHAAQDIIYRCDPESVGIVPMAIPIILVLQQFIKTAPELPTALGALKDCKDSSITLDAIGNGKAKLSISTVCQTNATSKIVKDALNEFWTQKAKPSVNYVKTLLPRDAPPPITSLVDEISTTMDVRTEGSQVIIATEFSENGLEPTLELLTEAALKLMKVTPDDPR